MSPRGLIAPEIGRRQLAMAVMDEIHRASFGRVPRRDSMLGTILAAVLLAVVMLGLLVAAAYAR